MASAAAKYITKLTIFHQRNIISLINEYKNYITFICSALYECNERERIVLNHTTNKIVK